MNDLVDVIVAITDDHLAELASVAERLARRGFILAASLPAAGVLLGSAPAAALGAISAESGVLSVERQRSDYGPY